MDQLPRHRFKRNNTIAQLTRLKDYYQGLNLQNLTNLIITQLEYRLNKVEVIYDEFNDLQTEIEFTLNNCEETDLQSLANEAKVRVDFENSYFDLITSVRDTITNFAKQVNNDNDLNDAASVHSGASSSNALRNSRDYSQSQVKLPTIKLPNFNGSYDRWLEFRDSFTALVDSNNSLSEIQKFYYLRSSLLGDAAHLIESIEVSASNYIIAWDLLKERFENKRLLVHNYVRTFFDIPILVKESHSELRKLFDTFTRSLRSLKTLGQPIEEWDTLIIHILTSKFDHVTRREWESYKIQGDLPTMEDINTFLKNKCEVLEKLELNKNDNKFNKQKGKPHYSSCISTTDNKFSCYYCKANHAIYHCEDFLKLDINSRIKEANRLKLCHNCLQSGHNAAQCKRSNCRSCKKRHNSLLHNNERSETSNNERKAAGDKTATTSTAQAESATVVASHVVNKNIAQVLLSTAIIYVKDISGKIHAVRALLDQGSQSHFITQTLCDKLRLKNVPVDYAITGVGQTSAEANCQTSLTIMSRINNFSCNITCVVLPKITQQLPVSSFDKSLLDIPKFVQLADPDFNISGDIDILLGVNVFYKVLCMKQICRKDQPVLQKTKLGWIIGGDLGYSNQQNNIVSCHAIACMEIDDNLSKFWELENCNTANQTLSKSDEFCESHFQRTHTRNNTGRFVVDIPFKENVGELGNSKEHAKQRFLNLEKRLSKNPSLKSDYSTFMLEYKKLGHMTKIEIPDDNELNYFLPHHAVVKDSSITTRVRVVFDASANSSSNLSLNDVQYCGPTIQSDLFSIILRFRQHAYVISADISKMYRQVLINPKQRKFQRIFWRDEPDNELDCYELNTITYGSSSAPFLAVRCLYQLGLENILKFPKASQIIMKDFYIDDLLSGAESAEELLEIQRDVTNILKGGGFELRKWLSNCPELSSKFLLNKELDASILQLGEHEQNKTLGVMWNSTLDTIQYSIRHIHVPMVLTKRHILSVTAQIFDPLGLLGPIVIVAKLILQLLWQEKLAWDDPVSDSIAKKWITFCKDLSLLNEFKIPRHVIHPEARNIELHGFADASQIAYGACVYLRCKLKNNSCNARLLCAKSRVAPLKTISLPRLELCAALLLAQLMSKVQSSINIQFSAKYYWSDSQITLCWIRGPPNKWKTFIANRVSEIQNLTYTNDWHHIDSKNNAADLLSRGTSCEQLINSSLWWQGPSVFIQDDYSWDIASENLNDSFSIPEQRIVSNITISDYAEFDLFTKYSSIQKLQRVLAYCFRFMTNARVDKQNRTSGTLTVSELNNSLQILIKISQIQSFGRDYHDLKNKTSLRKHSNILALNPFIDKQEIIRVGGRIRNANLAYNQKHPILLHNKHSLTRLLMENKHRELLHCGPQQLLYAIRENYWPISGRSLSKEVFHKCVTCFKANPKVAQYIMGDLPQTRVNQFSPFENTGIDYAGPISMKDRKTRGSKLLKVYVCIFICLATKAIHIELVTDLTTEAFLATLKRFIARRGKPVKIYSDNAKNFIGSDLALQKLIKSSSENIKKYLSNKGINWHFIPPRSPNFGGLWEAGVKSIKGHLKRVLGNASLTYEDLSTVLCQIEGVLNSRPLCPLSSNPTDPLPLTPGHFLTGKAITSIPEPSFVDVKEGRLSKYQRLQQLMQHFWTRWQREYISELQARGKWKKSTGHLVAIDDLVIVKEDHLPPGRWQIGRVVQLYPGTDKVVRVVSVKCGDTMFKRSLGKICKLPISDNNEK